MEVLREGGYLLPVNEGEKRQWREVSSPADEDRNGNDNLSAFLAWFKVDVTSLANVSVLSEQRSQLCVGSSSLSGCARSLCPSPWLLTACAHYTEPDLHGWGASV